MVFNSRLMHPLFTRLANLRQIVRRASAGAQDANKNAGFPKNCYQAFSKIFFTFPAWL
jgi:hypothetical protein